MEKILEGILWLSLINPCNNSLTQDTEEIQVILPLQAKNNDTKLNCLFENLNEEFTQILASNSLSESNRSHLIQFQATVDKFKTKLLHNEHSHEYNITPALKRLHESLEADCRVWKRYQEKNKISKSLYNKHLDTVKIFESYCCNKTKGS